jgi:transposase
MDKRIKYSVKQKEAVVRSILAGHSSVKSSGRELNCAACTVRRWLEQYKRYGSDGLKFRNGSYDGRFKVQVVQYFLRKKLSLKQTVIYFKIPNESVLWGWLKTYEQLGAEGLLKEARGRKRSTMTKKPRKKTDPSSDPSAVRVTELEKEVDYLRAENAFLKKLEALVQQEKAAKVPSRRQKPFGN